MEVLLIEQTEFTPMVIFEPNRKVYEITGRSYLENPQDFFHAVLTYIEKVFPAISHPIVLKVTVEYFNSASSRYLLAVFRLLNDFLLSGQKISIEWHYVDDETLSDGEMYEGLLKVPFNYVLNESAGE
ncbi:MAG: DUF1987 domain-containing protein [Salinivirgaceae bacterium]|nr:DUF1987 domain-containing protein [Salinivirgaceae bacterium]MDD4747912.1 DUF1987 domain-containing protein [Salinivirgaceae bacterium]MDY0281060.1 DUF1987 domain-containing protein [Salinivirgaceae bacterium]